MKTSSPTSPKPPQKKAVLLMGVPGARKTGLMLQFPSLHVIDCDQNLDGPDGAVRKLVKKDLSYSYDQVNTEDDGSQVDPGKCYERTVMLVKSPPPESLWLGLDGLSSINEYIIRKIMAEQRIAYMEARNWSTFKSDAYNLLFAKLRHCGKHVIVTAHTEEQTRNHPTEMMAKITTGYLPYLQSRAQEQLGGLFTDVWLIETTLNPGGKIGSTLYTDKLPLYKDLKNSCGLPAVIQDPTYDKLHQLSGGLI